MRLFLGFVLAASAAAQTFSVGSPVPLNRAVTGLPYSAETVSERVQTLADGTHITNSNMHTKFYRDSQGRTRTDTTIAAPDGADPSLAFTHVTIFDPVSGTSYMYDPKSHTGTRNARNARVLEPPPSSASAAPQTKRTMTHEDLGTRTIEGLIAQGSRRTTVLPVGSIGNDQPISTVTETWISPELKIVVLSKHSDPRSGEQTTKTFNISRTEPDPALFTVPADVTLVDQQ